MDVIVISNVSVILIEFGFVKIEYNKDVNWNIYIYIYAINYGIVYIILLESSIIII